jgi:hypothetical protein
VQRPLTILISGVGIAGPARTTILTLSAVRPDGRRTYDVALAMIGAYLLAHQIATSADLPTAFALWERGFRSNVELNQGLATDGMSTLLPASRFGIFARNQSMRVLPLFARYGRGFGGRIERASRAVNLPD